MQGRNAFSITALGLTLALVLSAGNSALAEEPEGTPAETAPAVESAPPEEDAVPVTGPSGEELYRRLLDNRKPAAVQFQRVIRRDESGEETESVLSIRIVDARNAQGEPDPDGVVQKSLLKFSEPMNARGSVFLIVDKADGTRDEFIWTPETRKSRRVTLGGQSPAPLIRLNDIGVREIGQASYTRLPDAEVEGVPVHVVEARFPEGAPGPLGKTVTYLTRDHYVPLKVEFFGRDGRPTGGQNSKPKSVKQLGGVWIGTETTITSPAGPIRLAIERYETELDISEVTFTPAGMARLRKP